MMRTLKVPSSEIGLEKAKEILYKNCDKDTILFLSGGNTPKPLYEKLASEQKLQVGALTMVDDRYSTHQQYSNEFMIRESGLVEYVEQKGGTFFSILEYGLSLTKTAEKYDEIVRLLLGKFPKRITILGIGTDGHVAGLPPKGSKIKVHDLEFVSYTNSFRTEPKVPRVSLNQNSLSLMDLSVVLAFGEDKREGIKKALNSFFKGQISKKTILITDQKI